VLVSGRIAILIVDGYSPVTPETTADAIRYPWIDLCLREVTRRSVGSDYEVHIWDNAGLSEHRKVMEATDRVRIWPEAVNPESRLSHAAALDRLTAMTSDDVEYLVLLDTDAIPIADDWLGTLTSKLDDGAAIVGVWRDEMAPELTPFVHVSCLCIRREELLSSGVSFSGRGDSEPGQLLTRDLLRRKRPVVAMRRTNAVNAHFLLGGIYGDTVYHHGAGSRPAWFYASPSQAEDERMRLLLRQAAFSDFDHLVSVLRGQAANDIWSEDHDPGRMDDEAQHRSPASDSVPAADPVMMAHYASGAELGRLESRNALEFERSKMILAERLPAGGRLIDVGGGPGTYAAWFASRGYQVDLVDPVPLHVEAAREASRTGTQFGAHLGDARQLPFADAVADAVVMMGPLFHLVTPEDRHQALSEAFRVVRPGGVIAASAMGRFFLFGHAVAQNAVSDPETLRRVMSIVDTGDRPGGWGPFPAFAHRPGDLEDEVRGAGFDDVVVVAIESFFHLLGDIGSRMADEASRSALFELLSRYETDPALLAMSGHLMAIGRRP
jgi:SAM-dependent methyltransferase